MKSDYKRIKGLGAGRRFQVAVRSRLYEGPDHLLIVQSTGYTEDYRRVFYKNIRYVVAIQDKRQMVHAIISAVLFVGISLLYFSSLYWLIVALMSLPFAIWYGVNWILGESCRSYINTDVQTLELPGPRRLKKVPVLISFLNAKVHAAQPEAEPEVV